MAKLESALILTSLFVMSAPAAVITLTTNVTSTPCAPVTSVSSASGSITQTSIANCSEGASSGTARVDTEGPELSVFANAQSRIYTTGSSFSAVRAAATETYAVVGGAGAAVLRLDYDITCGGNPGIFDIPLLRVSDGSTTQTNPGSPGFCAPQFRTGTLFQNLTSPDVLITITMDTLLFTSGMNDPGNERSLTVNARILDQNGFDVSGAALVAIPEPGSIWLFSAGLGALLLRRRRS